MERRLARLKLSLLRVAASIAVGALAGYYGGVACAAAPAAMAALYLLTGMYASRRLRVLRGREAWWVGLVSALAGFVVGLYLGTAITAG